MKIYFIPGLMANRNLFLQQLSLGFDAEVLEPIEPQKKETLENYIRRFSKKIDPSEPFILVGQSMGGMLAIELSKIVHPVKLIILSSAKNKNEFSPVFKLSRIFPIYRLVPANTIKKVILKGLEKSKQLSSSDRLLIKEMSREADPFFIKWAIDKMLHWEENICRKDIIHIHGGKDRVFPIKYVQNSIVLKDAGHLLLNVKYSTYINQILMEQIQSH